MSVHDAITESETSSSSGGDDTDGARRQLLAAMEEIELLKRQLAELRSSTPSKRERKKKHLPAPAPAPPRLTAAEETTIALLQREMAEMRAEKIRESQRHPFASCLRWSFCSLCNFAVLVVIVLFGASIINGIFRGASNSASTLVEIFTTQQNVPRPGGGAGPAPPPSRASK